MKKLYFFILIIIFSCSKENMKPPLIKSVVTVDEYYGKEIEDPYRNIENLEDSTVINWLQEQGEYASNILKSIPGRKTLIHKQTHFDDQKSFDTWGIRITNDGKYFYAKKSKDEKKYRIYYRKIFESNEHLLFDPTSFLSDTGESYQINHFNPDWEGKNLAISLAKEGEEISKIITMNVESRKISPEILENCKPNIGGIQWTRDNSGFVYMHFPFVDPHNPSYGLHSKSVFYKLGTDAHTINEVFSKSNNPDLNLKPEDYPKIQIISDTDDYVFGEVGGSAKFKDFYYKEQIKLLQLKSPWEALCKKEDKVKRFFLDQENNVIFLSAKNASNYKICKTNIGNLDFNNPEILIDESKNSVIDDFRITKEGIYFVRVKNGVEAKLYFLANNSTTEKEIVLPKPSGRVYLRSKGPDYSFLRVIIGGWLSDNEAYQYDLVSNNFKSANIKPLTKNKSLDSLVVEQVEVTSPDGVEIPLSLIYPKEMKKDKQNYTLFYGYGSYGGGIKPFYSPGFLTWAMEGGILAIAHVRGGGEKGDAWYKAGHKTTKSNTWKDMIACTEYMMKEGYTTPEKSAIWGSSAGGILAGRAMTERSDLYKAVILTSPSLNMVRSEIQPNGKNSIKEFGTVKIKEEFEALYEMDSYHHIKKGVQYPATLVTGGMKDGRVVIWDPAKFVARLQAYNSANNPVLFAVEFDQGHAGINSSELEEYEFYANPIAFAYWQLGHPDYQPKE